jgi:serine protease inhibitor
VAAKSIEYIGIRTLMVIFAMLLMISGCDKELTEAEESKILKKLSPQDLELINATNNLSLNIIQAEYEQNKERNFFFSPVSVGMALGMIYNGVGEKEKYQIQQMTGLETLVENEINKSYNEFITFLQLNYDQTNVFCANSLWFSMVSISMKTIAPKSWPIMMQKLARSILERKRLCNTSTAGVA